MLCCRLQCRPWTIRPFHRLCSLHHNRTPLSASTIHTQTRLRRLLRRLHPRQPSLRPRRPTARASVSGSASSVEPWRTCRSARPRAGRRNASASRPRGEMRVLQSPTQWMAVNTPTVTLWKRLLSYRLQTRGPRQPSPTLRTLPPQTSSPQRIKRLHRTGRWAQAEAGLPRRRSTTSRHFSCAPSITGRKMHQRLRDSSHLFCDLRPHCERGLRQLPPQLNSTVTQTSLRPRSVPFTTPPVPTPTRRQGTTLRPHLLRPSPSNSSPRQGHPTARLGPPNITSLQLSLGRMSSAPVQHPLRTPTHRLESCPALPSRQSRRRRKIRRPKRGTRSSISRQQPPRPPTVRTTGPRRPTTLPLHSSFRTHRLLTTTALRPRTTVRSSSTTRE